MDKFELDEEGFGTPPSYPGHGGDNGSHVSNYPTGNAFQAGMPPVGMDKPVEAPTLVDSTGGMKMRNDQKGGDKTAMPSFGKFNGAEHQVFESLSQNDTGRGVAESKVSHSASSAGLV